MEMEASICQTEKIQMNTKIKKSRKHIQNALKNKVTYMSQTLQNPYEEPIV